jgi:hypothetical protein
VTPVFALLLILTPNQTAGLENTRVPEALFPVKRSNEIKGARL